MNLERKIGIIDDDDNDLKLMENYFLSRGYVVDVYKNGQDAIRGLEKNTPPVVIIDFVLPDINGVEVFERTNHLPYQPIFISGLIQYLDPKKLAEKAPQLTSFSFCVKSADLSELYSHVNKLFEIEEQIRTGKLERNQMTEKSVETL